MTELQRKNREKKILKFLEERNCISAKCLEKQLGIPETTIAHAKRGNRGLPETAIEKLEVELKKYGYK